MIYHPSYETLLYQHEVLRSRLKIREHYLKTVVREVYENIGQILCLIRVQLAALHPGFENGQQAAIDSSGELVGKTIRDLRGMCRLLYPEEDIISGTGFTDALVQEIKILFPEAECYVQSALPDPAILRGEKGVILFGLLLELFTLIKEKQNGTISRAHIEYTEQQLNFCFNCRGDNLERSGATDSSIFTELSIFDRAVLVGGSLQIKNKEQEDIRIKLEVPIK